MQLSLLMLYSGVILGEQPFLQGAYKTDYAIQLNIRDMLESVIQPDKEGTEPQFNHNFANVLKPSNGK